MRAKSVVITFSLISSLQTKFKEQFQDINILSIGSDCGRLCAITVDEIAKLKVHTTMRRVFRNVRVPLLLSFLTEVSQRSFLMLRYKIVRIIAIFWCTSLCKRL